MFITIFDIIRDKIDRFMADGRPIDYKDERWRFARRVYVTSGACGLLIGIGLIVLWKFLGLSDATLMLVAVILLGTSVLMLTHKPSRRYKERMDMWWRGELPVWRFFWVGRK